MEEPDIYKRVANEMNRVFVALDLYESELKTEFESVRNTIKYFDTFTGYGGFTLGIQRAFGLDDRHKEAGRAEVVQGNLDSPASNNVQGTTNCIGYSEINKYAIQVYEKHFGCTTHTGQKEKGVGTTERRDSKCDNQCTNRFNGTPHKPYGDITKINPAELPDFDLLTGGFPCQAFSIAGKRQGFNDTRGTLFFDIARILKEKRPRNFILENVKGLLSHDNGRTFKTIITTLVELGYCVEWQVLNAKDFGVPQNRERVFIVGHLGGVPERKVFPLRESNEVNPEQNAQGDDLAHTLQAGGDKHRGSYIADNPSNVLQGLSNKRAAIRRLTPTECERLMGLPDDWTAGQSDTQRYKLCGNGVVVNVVEAVVRKLYGL